MTNYDVKNGTRHQIFVSDKRKTRSTYSCQIRWQVRTVPVVISNGSPNTHINGKIQYTDSNIMDAKKSAKLCAINILAQLEKNLGNLERVEKIIRINGFVNSQPDFTAHPKVIDAASDLMYSVFGDKGKHSRIAIGVQSLPLNSMTEIDALVQIC